MRIWMSCGKFAEEGDNPVNNPNIHNIVGDNRLSPGLQLLTTKSVFKMRFFFQSYSAIVFSQTGNDIVVFCKTKHSSSLHLRVVSV